MPQRDGIAIAGGASYWTGYGMDVWMFGWDVDVNFAAPQKPRKNPGKDKDKDKDKKKDSARHGTKQGG